MITFEQLKKQFTIANMLPVRIPKGVAAQVVRLRINGVDVAATYLTDLKEGRAIALLTDIGNWYLWGESLTVNQSTKKIIEYRKTQPPPKKQVGNIKILFSQIEDNNRVFYVLDEKSKKQVLSIDKSISIDSIQGNLFNYGVKNKYTNSLQYSLSGKLNVVNIVGDIDYPLWDVTQIYNSSNIPYLGASIVNSYYFNVNFNQQNIVDIFNPPSFSAPLGTVQTHTKSFDIVISTPSTYFDLSGDNSFTGLAIYINNTVEGDTGYFTYYELGNDNYNTNTKSFYTVKTTTSQIPFLVTYNQTESYNATINSSSSNIISIINITKGESFLGNFSAKDLVPYLQTETQRLEDSKSNFGNGLVRTNNSRIEGISLQTELLLIQGTSSAIVEIIDYDEKVTRDFLADTITPVVLDNCIYHLRTSPKPDTIPIVLNRETSFIVYDFSTKIIDENTTTVVAKATSTNFIPYIGHSISYAQTVDSTHAWLAVGNISNVVPTTTGVPPNSSTTYVVTITLTSVTSIPFVSYATDKGRAINSNGSIFALLNLFNTTTIIIDRYILQPNFDSGYLKYFTELLKYGCLIGNKFYICQNSEVVKTKKTDLYVEQWDIGSDGNITRNKKLIKISVNSLDSAASIIHSIQYWNKK